MLKGRVGAGAWVAAERRWRSPLPPAPPGARAAAERATAPWARSTAPSPAGHTRRAARRRPSCRADAAGPGGPSPAAASPSPAPAAEWAWASAMSRRVNLDLALTEAVGDALAACGPAEPDVAVVFASSAYAQSLDLLVPLLRRLLPTARVILGTTGFGVCGPAVANNGDGEDNSGGGGGGGGGRGHEEVEHAPAVSVALGALPGVQLALLHVQPPDLPDGDAPPDAWARLVGLPLELGPAAAGEAAAAGAPSPAAAADSTSFVVISDPTFGQIEELLAGLDFAYPASKKVGGLSSSGRLNGARALFCWSAEEEARGGAALDDSGVRRSGAVVLGLRGPLTMELMIAQGCRPLSRHVYSVAALAPGQRNVVTSVTDTATGAPYSPVDALRRDLSDPLQPIGSERDLAHVVSNLCCGLAPPEDVFAPFAPPRPPAAPAADTDAAATPVPAGAAAAAAAASEATTEYLIRGMGVTGDAHLAVGDSLRLGQSFRFMVRDAEGARSDLAAHGTAYKRRQLSATLAGRPEPPALGALLFSCNGRGAGLYGEEGYDTRQVASYLGAPVAGFQCNGEIGSVGDSTKLHGFTAAVAILRAGASAAAPGGDGSQGADGSSGGSGGGTRGGTGGTEP